MFLLQLCILKTHTLRGKSTHYSIPRALLQFSEYHGIKVWMYLRTFSWTISTTDKCALRPTKWGTNQEPKAANSTLFQFHLQRKSNHILLCKAHLTTCNILDFHETRLSILWMWLWSMGNIWVILTISNSPVAFMCDVGPGLESQWAPPAALSAPSASDRG